jgi:prevent-host-death family protein
VEVTSREFQKEIGKHIDVALSGEPVIITRHGRPSVVLSTYEQVQQWSFSDPRWRSVLDRMAQRWPVPKTDYELIADLLQKWEIEQNSESSKSAILQEISEDVKAIRRKLNA